jgi:DNA polymerase-1
MFGRKRMLGEINSTIPMVKKAAERMAANTPLQGTAADIIKIAMIKIHNKVLNDDIKMLIQVHDELIFEVKKGQEKTAIKQITKIMENVVELKVHMRVDAKMGKNWGEMEPITN